MDRVKTDKCRRAASTVQGRRSWAALQTVLLYKAFLQQISGRAQKIPSCVKNTMLDSKEHFYLQQYLPHCPKFGLTGLVWVK